MVNIYNCRAGMGFLLTMLIVCNWKRCFFYLMHFGMYIHKLNKIWFLFLKKDGTSQALGSQHWATIGANKSIHEKMGVWNEVLTDFWCNVKFSCWPTNKCKTICKESLAFYQQSLQMFLLTPVFPFHSQYTK